MVLSVFQAIKRKTRKNFVRLKINNTIKNLGKNIIQISWVNLQGYLLWKEYFPPPLLNKISLMQVVFDRYTENMSAVLLSYTKIRWSIPNFATKKAQISLFDKIFQHVLEYTNKHYYKSLNLHQIRWVFVK